MKKFAAVLPGTHVTCVPMRIREIRCADIHKQELIILAALNFPPSFGRTSHVLWHCIIFLHLSEEAPLLDGQGVSGG
jgi:hypothetical protein